MFDHLMPEQYARSLDEKMVDPKTRHDELTKLLKEKKREVKSLEKELSELKASVREWDDQPVKAN